MFSQRKEIFVPSLVANDHLSKVTAHFQALNWGRADIPGDVRFIFICFTNRSGSNYLAELLASDGTLAVAGENLNFETVIDHAQARSLKSFQEYFAFLVRHTVQHQTVTIKVSPAHLELLERCGILEQIFNRSRFVVIERSDKLSQAISHSIAFQTGRFMSTMGDPGAAVEPKFDRDQLDAIIDTIADEYHDFSLFFARNGLAPAHVIYEQLVQDPVRTLAFVGPLIGHPNLKILPGNVRLARQSNKLNEAWRQRYLQERRQSCG